MPSTHRLKKRQRTFRFELKPEYVAGSIRVVTARSTSIRGALMKLGRHFNDVKQFSLVNNP